MRNDCIDPIVGGILAGWRYDISGIAPAMRGDYEDHLATCEHCRARQRFHRRIDIGLLVLTSLSAAVFLAAFVAVRYFAPRHALELELLAAGGFGVSVAMAIMVGITTPAPLVVKRAARETARQVHDRLPEEIRNRIPEEVRMKISGEPPQ
ncbi:MAG: hypothetical protein JO041_16030 [Acidobacteria bacterium]|nr:hypothetical protein [Acidobacteriota bacterium]